MRLSARYLDPEFLQWFGLFGAALTWTVQLVVGFGVTIARCGSANAVLGVDVKAWELALMGTGIALALLAEAAALNILWQTRNVDYGGPPPEGRRHFFALAASIGNVLFLVVIVLSGTGAVFHQPCTQS
jgi:hypothetical protein